MNSLNVDKNAADTRVVVAMSGGVDSSATAAMLVEQGYDVVGITLQLYDHGVAIGRRGACCAGEDIYDARCVANRLGIPHYVLDYERRFRQQVIDDFADSYLAGETPVPCIRCNQTVKFTDLMTTARELGADVLATGHYVRWRPGTAGAELHRGADPARDQSYFLFATTPQQLGLLRFPLGDFRKDETRQLAARHGLPVAAKADSQDICFVPTGGYAGVLAKLRPEANRPGDIVDLDGVPLGRHAGIAHFTVGQRRGLGIASDRPLYVIRIDPETDRVIVGPFEALLRDRFSIREVNWLGDGTLDGDGVRLHVKVRSTQPPLAATVFGGDGGVAEVVLDKPEAGVAPGQACVFYDGERMCGGGWICRPVAAE